MNSELSNLRKKNFFENHHMIYNRCCKFKVIYPKYLEKLPMKILFSKIGILLQKFFSIALISQPAQKGTRSSRPAKEIRMLLVKYCQLLSIPKCKFRSAKKFRMLLVKNCLLFSNFKVYQWLYNEAMQFVLGNIH